MLIHYGDINIDFSTILQSPATNMDIPDQKQNLANRTANSFGWFSGVWRDVTPPKSLAFHLTFGTKVLPIEKPSPTTKGL